MIQPVEFGKLKPLIQNLGQLRLRRIYKETLGKEMNERELVKPSEALVMIFAGILRSRNLVREDQLDLIIDELGKEILKFGKMLEETADKDNLPVAHLIMVDRMFVRMSGEIDFLDIRSGKKINKIELPPIEILTFDLTALLVRTTNAIKAERPNVPN